MHFGQSFRHNKTWPSDAGSQVVGFVLIVPLLISCTILLVNLLGVVGCQMSLIGRAKQGAHYASLWGSSSSGVAQIVAQRWRPVGLSDCGLEVTVTKPHFGRTKIVKVDVEQCLAIPILQKQINLRTSASEILERDL